MKKLMRKRKSIFALLLCVIMFFNSIVFDTGNTSYAATTLNLKLTLNKNGSITSTWSKVSGAATYDLLLTHDAPTTCYANQRDLTTTTYTSIANLPDNELYSVVVSAYDNRGVCIDSELVKVLIPSGFYNNTTLGIPQNVGASSTSTSVTVSWSSVTGATNYDILFDGSPYNVTGTSKTFTGLSSNTKYTYSVRAKNGGGSSSYSALKTVKTRLSVPSVPTNVSATSTINSVRVSWSGVSGAASYSVIFNGITYSERSTSITINRLPANTGYTYSVCANNDAGSSSFSTPRTVTTLPNPPVVPTNITATATASTATVSWSPSAGATSYDVIFNGTTYHVTDTSKTFTGLSPSTGYTYSVCAKNAGGVSSYSSLKGVTTLPNPPSVPRNVSATATTNSATVSWGEVAGAKSYDVIFNGITHNVTSTSKTFTGLSADTRYNYSVRANNVGGASPFSDTNTITTLPNPPSVPIDVSATATANTATISWSAVSGATNYDVIFNGKTYNVTGTTRTFTRLSPSTDYTYSVRANNRGGSSSYSTTKTVTTLPNPPETPSDIKVTSTLNNVTVSWSPVEGATDYSVTFNGKTTSVTGTSKTFSGLKPNTYNSYSVEANNKGGSSTSSPTGIISTKISKKSGVPNEKSVKTYSNGKSSYLALDPVNALTGSFLWNYTYLEDYGKDPLHFTIMYDSQGDESQKVLGRKWTYSLNYLLYMDNDYAYFSTPNGDVVPFRKNINSGEFQLAEGIKSDYKMGRKDDETYFIRDIDGTEYQFDKNLCLSTIIENGLVTYLFRANNEGQIISIAGQHGGILTLEYTDGHISRVSNALGNSVTFAYGGDNLIFAKNPDGDNMYFTYDDLANLLMVTDYYGKSNVTNQYDSTSRVIKQSIAGRGESYAAYDEENRTTTFKDELGNATTYTYDEEMNVTSVELAGSSEQNKYNSNGQIIEHIDPLGNSTEMTYDEVGRLNHITYPDKTEEHFTYNDRNYPVKVVNRDGTETEYGYDVNNNVISIKDERGNTEQFSYDSNDNLMSHTDKNGNTSTYSYDANHNLKTYTDPEGNTYQYSHDDIGRLSSYTTPTGKKTSYQYSAAGNLLRIEDEDGTVVYDYDKNGNNTGIENKMGNKQQFGYNDMGQVSMETDFMGNKYNITYNQRGDMIGETDPLGYNQSYEYDALGNVVALTDKNGNKTYQTFDAASQLTEIKDAAGNATKYAYDTRGQIKSVTDPLSNQTQYNYDAMGNATEVINALGYTEKSTYDQAGNLLTQTDESGGVTTYSYDNENRLATITSDAGMIRFTYDKLGRLIATEDTDKFSETVKYDAEGNMIESCDKESNQTTYAYDSSGRISEETDPKGNKTLYEYDRNGNCTKITDAEGNIYAYQYDANDQLTQVTDPMGNITSYTYNARMELESVTDAGGGKTTFEYDGNGNIMKEVNPVGGVKLYTYDSLNRMIGMEDENGYRQSFSYDAAGNVISYTDANQNKWTYEYDALSRLTGVTDQKGGSIALSYGSRGELRKLTDQEGAETSYQYDTLGRMTEMSDALGNRESFLYDSLGRVIGQTDACGNATEYQYSPVGNLLSVKDAEGNTTSYTYNAINQMMTKTDAQGNEVCYEYDALGQVTSILDPMGGRTSFTYTPRGEIATVTDAKGGITSYQYDANGNLSKTTDALGNVVAYEYDAMSNQIRQYASDLENQTCATLYQYDKKGQIVREINPMAQEKTYSYDGNGNIVKILDEDQYKTEIVYDLNNQPANMHYSDGKEATFRYNKRGELVELKDWTGTVKMEYNKVGNRTKVTDHNGKTTGYSYDANGNNTGIAYPDGSAVGYTYDKNNRMTKVVDAEQQVTQYVYDSEGNTLQMQQPGSATSYTYNKNGLPTQILYQMKDGTQMEDNLTYDAIGNIVSSVKKGSTSALTEDETYSYDAIGQLLSYTKGQKTESYTYDMLGNMTEKRVNGTPDATYQYNASNQLTNKTENGIAYSYRYDKRGNQVEEMCGDQVTRQYIYDATNHMVLGRNSENGEKSEYVYNGLSMRVKNVQKLEQTDSSYENYGESAVGKNRQAFRTKETNYVIDYLSDTNNDLLSYETGFGATRVTYGRGSERLSQNVTIYPETPRTMRTDIAQENNGKSYFQTDRLGSVLFASNQEGEVLRYADRDAWGNLQVPVQDDINSAGIADSLGFTNYNYDPVLDQYFAQARFYDAKQGRMLAVDPVKTGLNRYLYCKNDPLNYIDPLGATAQNVKAGISISNKGILTGAANALTGYKKALSSVGNIGNDGSSFANANKCSSNKGTGNLRLLRVLVDDDTWYSPSTGNLVDNNTKGKKLFAYEQDLLNMKNSDNILEAAGNLGKYFWDRWPGLWGELNEQNALNAGLDPEWAELCGDFSSALLLEGFITTTVKGVRAYKNIKTGKIIYANSVVGRGTKGASNSGKWIDDAGNIKWPKNDGFAGSTKNVTLQPGTVIDRYGYESGTFVSPKGVPYEMRSLAPGTELKPYNVYEVIKPLDGLGGKAAAWFDQPGGGTQYKLSKSIQELLDEGYIKEVIK